MSAARNPGVCPPLARRPSVSQWDGIWNCRKSRGKCRFSCPAAGKMSKTGRCGKKCRFPKKSGQKCRKLWFGSPTNGASEPIRARRGREPMQASLTNRQKFTKFFVDLVQARPATEADVAAVAAGRVWIENSDSRTHNPIRAPYGLPNISCLIVGLRSFLHGGLVNNPSGSHPTPYLIPLRSSPAIQGLHRDRHTLLPGFGFGFVNSYSFGCNVVQTSISATAAKQ